LDAIGQQLKGYSFERVGSRQMAGLLICVWVRTHLKQFIGDIDNAAVACGLGRAIGNKVLLLSYCPTLSWRKMSLKCCL
jgi:hypothetical protein